MTDDSTHALAFIRRSQGDEDGASLRLQRDQVPELADELADSIDTVDLGVHTGFSILSRDEGDPRIDANDEVLKAVERVRNGEYEYVVSWDDSRLARDDYFAEWRRAAAEGGAEFAFVADVEDVDSMAHGVRRTVETAIKREEIQKAIAAVRDREQREMWNTRPPVGVEFDSEREYLVPGEQFDDVIDALEMRADGVPYRTVADETGLSRGAIGRWVDNVEVRARSCRDDETARQLIEAASTNDEPDGLNASTTGGEAA